MKCAEKMTEMQERRLSEVFCKLGSDLTWCDVHVDYRHITPVLDAVVAYVSCPVVLLGEGSIEGPRPGESLITFRISVSLANVPFATLVRVSADLTREDRHKFSCREPYQVARWLAVYVETGCVLSADEQMHRRPR